MMGLNLNIAIGDVDEQPETVEDQERDGIFPVEDIRKKKHEKGEVLYQVKWRDLPESANTWEPLANLESCAALINAYEERRKTRKKARKFRPKSSTAAGAPSRGRAMEAEDDNDLNMKISELMKVNAAAAATPENNTVTPPVRLTRARRRKSGAVKRFLPEAADAGTAVDHATEDLSFGMKEVQKDALTLAAPPFENIPITEILEPISSTTRTLNNVEDVLFHFHVKRADGTLLTVDNYFLTSNYPGLIIDYYHHRLSLPARSPLLITGEN